MNNTYFMMENRVAMQHLPKASQQCLKLPNLTEATVVALFMLGFLSLIVLFYDAGMLNGQFLPLLLSGCGVSLLLCAVATCPRKNRNNLLVPAEQFRAAKQR